MWHSASEMISVEQAGNTRFVMMPEAETASREGSES
jgi:hypothetical protein